MKQTLGIIEKCSIRRKVQSQLIQLELIQWILEVLKTSNELDQYTLEYITALLMNLVLRTEGKKVSHDPKLEMVKTLIPLLSIESEQIRTHVNGTLYAILTTRAMRQEAKVSLIFS